MIWKANVQKQQMTNYRFCFSRVSFIIVMRREGKADDVSQLTRAAPAFLLPVVAPVQYRAPTANRITTTKV